MITKTITSECNLRDIICDIPHKVTIEEHASSGLYNINIHTSKYLTDPPRFNIFISKEMLQELYDCIGDILQYKEKREE